MFIHKLKLFTAVCLLVFSSVAFSGNNDLVKNVYSCYGGVAIKMQNAGWVFAKDSQIGEKRVDRILSVALSLLATGKPSGYFDDNSATETLCGLEVKPITALAITSGD